ncbi:DNA-binding response regulator [Paenibacillus marinisediminis]
MRLVEGHGYAEKLFLERVWFPAFRSFDRLYPEYEVADFRDGSRFIDFAYIRYPLQLAIEIDGYGTHSAKASRWQFSDSLIRQNHLVIDGWRILRFSCDDVEEKPRMCEQLLQQFLGSWISGEPSKLADTSELLEREVLRYALSLNRKIQPHDVCELLKVSIDKAYSILHSMLRNGSLLPGGKGEKRTKLYEVNRSYIDRMRLFS